MPLTKCGAWSTARGAFGVGRALECVRACMHRFHIDRCDPDADTQPRMQVLELDVPGSDRMLVDVLIRLKAIDPSLA
jgi:hypothetical protein